MTNAPSSPTATRTQRLAALRALLSDNGWTVEIPGADTSRNAAAINTAHEWLRTDGIAHRDRRASLIARACRQLRGEAVRDWQRGRPRKWKPRELA